MKRVLSVLRRLRGPKEAPTTPEHGPLYPAVRDALIDVQAYARSHGGKIELVSVDDKGEVVVKFQGACKGCPIADLTFKLGIEQQLKTLVPGVTGVKRQA